MQKCPTVYATADGLRLPSWDVTSPARRSA